MQRLRRRFPQEDEALLEDAVTQALELLVRQPGRYDPRRGSLLSWLWGVVWRSVHYAERQKNLRAQLEVPQGFREKVWRQVVTLLGVRDNIIMGGDEAAWWAAARRLWRRLSRHTQQGLRRLASRASLRRWQEWLGLVGEPTAVVEAAVRREKARWRQVRCRLRRQLARLLAMDAAAAAGAGRDEEEPRSEGKKSQRSGLDRAREGEKRSDQIGK
jgi:hypothetical protein